MRGRYWGILNKLPQHIHILNILELKNVLCFPCNVENSVKDKGKIVDIARIKRYYVNV